MVAAHYGTNTRALAQVAPGENLHSLSMTEVAITVHAASTWYMGSIPVRSSDADWEAWHTIWNKLQ